MAAGEAAIVHGSTVATNALLERKGARTALITTAGFADVLEIGRQTRPKLYDLSASKPEPFVPAERRFEVTERVDYQGQVLIPLDPAALDPLIERLAASDVESVAVCLLFSFLRPEHEEIIGERLRAANRFHLSLSSEILPEYREFERTSTTVMNAYVGPLMDHYLGHLEAGLGRPIRVMQSNGGIISAAVARQAAVRTALSGPAGGVIGARFVAQLAGFEDIITFDIGGTSTDVALCPGRLPIAQDAEIAGFPVRVPMIDIHTVGAGGGSIARVDAGGALVVGPESAGSRPGPVCYGQGDRITVTDAHLALGRLDADHFLGGRMHLDTERMKARLADLAGELGLSPEEAAAGILRVANSNLEKATRQISIERGHDPRRFALLAFGGAGPLHACELAAELQIPRVIVPRYPGVLSALGMLAADVVKDYSQTLLARTDDLDPALLERAFAPLEEAGWEELRREGFADDRIVAERELDLRYRGQSYELVVPLARRTAAGNEPSDLAAAVERFHDLHRQRFGHSNPAAPTEIVNVRLRMIGLTEKPAFAEQPRRAVNPTTGRVGRRTAIFGDSVETDLFQRADLLPGQELRGPAIVFQLDATTVIPPGWTGAVDGYLNLILEPR